MTAFPDLVLNHYRPIGLVERLKTALSGFGPEDQKLAPLQLSGLDQFHTRGLAATADLASLAGVTAETSVLDVGSGTGGPVRYLAATYGCRVEGVDLSELFVDAARYLAQRTGQAGLVSFTAGSAPELPFEDASFDVVFLQHVAMNIADRPRLYRGIFRVLKPGGRFATFDVVSNGAEPHYPVPWALSSEASFLMTGAATREAVEAAGFRTLIFKDDTEAAKGWFCRVARFGAAAVAKLRRRDGPGHG